MTHVVPVQYALRQHRNFFEHPCLSNFRLEDLAVSPELVTRIGKLTLSKVKLLICSLSRPVADSDRLFTTN